MTDYLLVHGACCGGWVWDDVADRLAQAGSKPHVVDQLPSGGSDPRSLGGLNADADHVHQQLDRFEDPVVLVGHSYGGMVLTELADHPMVRSSVYLTAVWPQRGQSVSDLFGGTLPNSLTRRTGDCIAVTDDIDVACNSFGRGFERDAAEQMLSRFVLQSEASWHAKSTAPDRAHPTTYMIAEGEVEGAVAAQDAWSANADQVVRLRGAHMLMLSHPDEVAEALLGVSIS